ncbi:MAG: hypothetical protein QOK21_1308 [Solirubrobacteraceae bacterium]|nr:hypothetical protein [Solirubrobacteraceae bacterium]
MFHGVLLSKPPGEVRGPGSFPRPDHDTRRMNASSAAAWSLITRSASSASVAGSRRAVARATSARTRSPSRTLAGVGPQSSRNDDHVSSSTATRATRAPGESAEPPRSRSALPADAWPVERGLLLRLRRAIAVARLYTAPQVHVRARPWVALLSDLRRQGGRFGRAVQRPPPPGVVAGSRASRPATSLDARANTCCFRQSGALEVAGPRVLRCARSDSRERGHGLSLLLLLCQEIDGWGCPGPGGAGSRSRCQMRRARWRLRQRMASLVVLPSERLRSR